MKKPHRHGNCNGCAKDHDEWECMYIDECGYDCDDEECELNDD